jgi:hypothetical protein
VVANHRGQRVRDVAYCASGASAPRCVERIRAHSLPSFAAAPGPYCSTCAANMAAVESVGRSLRIEVAHHGVDILMAYLLVPRHTGGGSDESRRRRDASTSGHAPNTFARHIPSPRPSMPQLRGLHAGRIGSSTRASSAGNCSFKGCSAREVSAPDARLCPRSRPLCKGELLSPEPARAPRRPPQSDPGRFSSWSARHTFAKYASGFFGA